MKKLLLLLLIPFAGCYTQRNAVKQSVKAYTHYPDTIAGLHIKWFPTKDSTTILTEYLQGEDIVSWDTLHTTDTLTDVKVVYLTKTIRTTDTVRIKSETTKARTDELQAKDAIIKKLQDDATAMGNKNASLKTGKQYWMWGAIAGWLIIIATVAIRIWKPKLLS